MSTCSNLVCVSATLLTAAALVSLLPSKPSATSEDCVDWNAQMDRVDDAYNRHLTQFSHCFPATATDAQRLTYLQDCTGSEAESRNMDLFNGNAYIRDNQPKNCKRARILENAVHFKGSNKPQNHQKAHR